MRTLGDAIPLRFNQSTFMLFCLKTAYITTSFNEMNIYPAIITGHRQEAVYSGPESERAIFHQLHPGLRLRTELCTATDSDFGIDSDPVALPGE